MKKHRKAYYEIEKVLQGDIYSIVILLGLRRVGKTTILRQLAERYNGYYIDFRDSKDPESDYYNALDSSKDLILLDEIGYLPDFDAFLSSFEMNNEYADKKIVVTSSSYSSMRQLVHERLGGGRSYRVELFPLSFEEYLYFSDKIENYADIYESTDEDLQNFYRMKDLPQGMGFFISKEYMYDNFRDAEVAQLNQKYVVRSEILIQRQYAAVIDVIAYTLNYQLNIKRFGSTPSGRQEFEKDVKGLDLSQSLIGAANTVSDRLDFLDISHILLYLLTSGFLFIDLLVDRDGFQGTDAVLSDLRTVKVESDLDTILRTYVFSVVSPLIYTRLLCDLEDIVGKFCSNRHLYGELYELTVKSESIYNKYQDFGYTSYKYYDQRFGNTLSVDLYVPGQWSSKGLLLEAALGTKRGRDHSVVKILKDRKLIRVLTDACGKWEFKSKYYRIGYPQALLLVSNNKIYDLDATDVGD